MFLNSVGYDTRFYLNWHACHTEKISTTVPFNPPQVSVIIFSSPLRILNQTHYSWGWIVPIQLFMLNGYVVSGRINFYETFLKHGTIYSVDWIKDFISDFRRLQNMIDTRRKPEWKVANVSMLVQIESNIFIMITPLLELLGWEAIIIYIISIQTNVLIFEVIIMFQAFFYLAYRIYCLHSPVHA